MFQDIVILLVVRNVDIFSDQNKFLVETIGMFASVSDAEIFRSAIVDGLGHGDAAVILATNITLSAVYHDVLVVEDKSENAAQN